MFLNPPHLRFSENWQFNVVTQFLNMWIFLRISRFLDKAFIQFSWRVHIYLVPLLLPCFLLLCCLRGLKSAPYKSYLKLNMRYNMKISLLHHPPRLYRPVLPPVTTVSILERDVNRIFKRKALQNGSGMTLWSTVLPEDISDTSLETCARFFRHHTCSKPKKTKESSAVVPHHRPTPAEPAGLLQPAHLKMMLYPPWLYTSPPHTSSSVMSDPDSAIEQVLPADST